MGLVLGIEQLVSVEDLYLQLGSVEKLHRGPIGGIEERLQMVAVIYDANVHTRLILLSDSLRDAILRESDEFVTESLSAAGFQCSGEIMPRERVIARYPRARKFFDGAWSEPVSIEADLWELNLGRLNLGRRLRDRRSASGNRKARGSDDSKRHLSER